MTDPFELIRTQAVDVEDVCRQAIQGTLLTEQALYHCIGVVGYIDAIAKQALKDLEDPKP